MTAPAYLAPDVGSAPGWPLVLYFHHVHPSLEHYTSLTPESFARGLETVLEHVGEPLAPDVIMADRSALPDRPTVLFTFDDGYRDVLDYALPILDAFGIRALFFLISDRSTAPTPVPSSQPWDAYLGWEDARELERAGHLVGAHSRTHMKLTELDADAQSAEIDGSLASVATELARPGPVHFAYPYGLVPPEPRLPTGSLGFGTVKAPPVAWSADPRRIRRTYLPTLQEEEWKALCRRWRTQWWETSP